MNQMQDENTKTEPCKNDEQRSENCIYCDSLWSCDEPRDEEGREWKKYRQSWRVQVALKKDGVLNGIY